MTARVVATVCGLLLACAAAADVIVSEGTNISVDAAADGRIAMDLLDRIWVLAPDGGDATAITSGLRAASRPRWSPAGDSIVFEARNASRSELWHHRFGAEDSEALSNTRHADVQPDWHPDGERVVFSSARHDSGFDLWEIDLPTRLSWRLTSLPGNESEPTWSADGRNLAFVHEQAGTWSIVVRWRNGTDEVLASSDTPLAAPSWRPDGSLVTYMRRGEEGWSIRMTILSEPRLDRLLVRDTDIFIAPVSWLDRQQLLYTANGSIRQRDFNSWASRDLPFRARVDEANGYESAVVATRDLPAIERPAGRSIIRAGRLFDGISGEYVDRPDIVIEDGRVVAIESHRDRGDQLLVDLDDLTVLPGFIDAYASLPAQARPSLGPLLLSLGVTTLVTDHPDVAELDRIWSGKQTPGPRVLRAETVQDANTESPPWLVTVGGDPRSASASQERVREWRRNGVAVLADGWQVGQASGASIVLGTESRPSSPAGRRYQDTQRASGTGAMTFVSGLADAATPGLAEIWRSRQAALMSTEPKLMHRFTSTRDLSAAASNVVLGSKPNELPPGIALHAELRALVAAGLSEEQALKAAGVNTARALGFGLRLGRIATGAEADLVVVDGDPLQNIDDALKIVGIVRNGRFYSVSGLIDRAQLARNVE